MKTKLLIAITLLTLLTVSMSTALWGAPTKNPLPTRTPSPTPPKPFVPNQTVFLPMAINDRWTPPWWVPHLSWLEVR